MSDVVVFWGPEAGLSAAASETITSVTRLVKVIEGLNGAVQRARLDGLADELIADHLAPLVVTPVAIRAALAADCDGSWVRFLVASLIAVPDTPPRAQHGTFGCPTHATDRAWSTWR